MTEGQLKMLHYLRDQIQKSSNEMFGLAQDLAAVGFFPLASRAREAATRASKAANALNTATGELVSGFVHDADQSTRNLFAGLAAGAALATGSPELAGISKAIKDPQFRQEIMGSFPPPGPDPSENCPDCKAGKPCYGHNHR